MNIDTGCDQCYAIHIYLDCLASKFLTQSFHNILWFQEFLSWLLYPQILTRDF